MRQARWQHGLRSGIAVVLLLLLVFGGVSIRNTVLAEQDRIRKQKQAEQNEAEASRLVDGLLKADTSQVKSVIDDLKDYRQWANPELKTAFAKSATHSNAKLHAGLALLPVDDSVLGFLGERLLNVSPVQFAPVRDLLADHKQALAKSYWPIALDPKQEAARRFQAACALASFDPQQDQWKDENFVEFLASHLVRVGPADLAPWREALRPVQDHLIDPLTVIYKDPKQGEQVRSFATDTLADYLSDDPAQLFDLLADATEPQFRVIYGKLSEHREQAIPLAASEITKQPAEDASEDEKEILAQRQANAAVLLLRLGQADLVWPLLKHSPDPRVRSYLIHWLSPRGGDPQTILSRYENETDVSIQRALLLCLGEFDATNLPPDKRSAFVAKLLDVYRTHPDAGIHGAAEWVLRQWGQGERIAVHRQRTPAKRGATASQAKMTNESGTSTRKGRRL